MGSFFSGKKTTTRPESVVSPDLVEPRSDFSNFVSQLIESLGQGGGLPRASTEVAPLDSRIQEMLTSLGGVQSQAGAPGAITSARSTLEDIIRTGLPTATAGFEDALFAKKQLLDRTRNADVTEQFGARGGRFGSPLAVGLARGQEASDIDYLNTIAGLRYGSGEAASKRRTEGTFGAPGFEQGNITRLLSALILGLNMAPFLQTQAQLPNQVRREEDIRAQENALRFILPFLVGFPPTGTPTTTQGASPFASILGPLLGIGASLIPGVGPFLGPAMGLIGGSLGGGTGGGDIGY